MTGRTKFLRTMRGQFAALLLGALALAQGLGIWLFIEERRHAMTTSVARDGMSRIRAVARELERSETGMHPVLLRAASSFDFRLSIDEAAFALEEGAEALRAAWMPAPPPSGTQSGPEVSLAYRESASFRSLELPGDPEMESDPEILVASTRLGNGQWLNARIDTGGPHLRWAWAALVSFVLTTAAAIVVVWILINRITGPLRHLSESADRLGRGHSIHQADCSGPSEVRLLATAFNQMAGRLTKLIEERSIMLGALGHDLRSPLTAMRIRLELIDDDETRERLENCLDEMQSLVQSALALAHGSDAGEPVKRVPLAALLDQIATGLREEGGNVHVSILRDSVVEAREAGLKRALRNIAENAVRYGHTARITLDRRRTGACVSIEDEGPGIPAAERERVFVPFQRLEASRSRDTGGTGLGLAIARAVVESHGGSITIEETAGTGARFVILLPTSPDEPG